MVTVRLPSTLEFGTLQRAVGSAGAIPGEDIVVDFAGLSFVTPTGLAPLAALIDRWLNENHRVVLSSAPMCQPFEYLQRVDFFKHFGIFEEERFTRHAQRGRFASLAQIRMDCDTKKVATDLGHSISGGSEFDIVRSDLHNCLYESLNNIVDHAGLAGRFSGYAMAQSYRHAVLGRRYMIAIADPGRGIAASLRANSRLSVPDDAAALELACRPGVSGAEGVKNDYGDPRNVGQGLTQIDIIAESTGGSFVLVSGGALRFRSGGEARVRQMLLPWQGTLVFVTLSYRGIQDYVESIRPTGRIRLG